MTKDSEATEEGSVRSGAGRCPGAVVKCEIDCSVGAVLGCSSELIEPIDTVTEPESAAAYCLGGELLYERSDDEAVPGLCSLGYGVNDSC